MRKFDHTQTETITALGFASIEELEEVTQAAMKKLAEGSYLHTQHEPDTLLTDDEKVGVYAALLGGSETSRNIGGILVQALVSSEAALETINTQSEAIEFLCKADDVIVKIAAQVVGWQSMSNMPDMDQMLKEILSGDPEAGSESTVPESYN